MAGQGWARAHQGLLAWRSRRHHEATMILQQPLPGRLQFWKGTELASAGWPLQRRKHNRPKAAALSGRP